MSKGKKDTGVAGIPLFNRVAEEVAAKGGKLAFLNRLLRVEGLQKDDRFRLGMFTVLTVFLLVTYLTMTIARTVLLVSWPEMFHYNVGAVICTVLYWVFLLITFFSLIGYSLVAKYREIHVIVTIAVLYLICFVRNFDAGPTEGRLTFILNTNLLLLWLFCRYKWITTVTSIVQFVFFCLVWLNIFIPNRPAADFAMWTRNFPFYSLEYYSVVGNWFNQQPIEVPLANHWMRFMVDMFLFGQILISVFLIAFCGIYHLIELNYDQKLIVKFSVDLQNMDGEFLHLLAKKPDLDCTRIENLLKNTVRQYLQDKKYLPQEALYRTSAYADDDELEDLVSDGSSSVYSARSQAFSDISSASSRGSSRRKSGSILSDMLSGSTSHHMSRERTVVRQQTSYIKKGMISRDIVIVLFSLENVVPVEQLATTPGVHNTYNQAKDVITMFYDILFQVAKQDKSGVFVHRVYGNKVFCSLNSLKYIVDSEKRALRFAFAVREQFEKLFLTKSRHVQLRCVLTKRRAVLGFVTAKQYNQYVFAEMEWNLLFFLTRFSKYLDYPVFVDSKIEKKVKYNVDETVKIDTLKLFGKKYHFYAVKGTASGMTPKADEWMYEIQDRLDEKGVISDHVEKFWECISTDEKEEAQKYLTLMIGNVSPKLLSYLRDYKMADKSVFQDDVFFDMKKKKMSLTKIKKEEAKKIRKKFAEKKKREKKMPESTVEAVELKNLNKKSAGEVSVK